jgi:hypothetical protein
MSDLHKTLPPQEEASALEVIIAIVFIVLALAVLPWQSL